MTLAVPRNTNAAVIFADDRVRTFRPRLSAADRRLIAGLQAEERRMDRLDAAEADRRLNDPKEKPISYAKARKMLGMGKRRKR